MFVPHRWMHMVVNIGDTVSVISEIGLGGGKGLKEEELLVDPPDRSRLPHRRLDAHNNDRKEEENSDDSSRDYWIDSEDSSQDYWSQDSADWSGDSVD